MGVRWWQPGFPGFSSQRGKLKIRKKGKLEWILWYWITIRDISMNFSLIHVQIDKYRNSYKYVCICGLIHTCLSVYVYIKHIYKYVIHAHVCIYIYTHLYTKYKKKNLKWIRDINLRAKIIEFMWKKRRESQSWNKPSSFISFLFGYFLVLIGHKSMNNKRKKMIFSLKLIKWKIKYLSH